MPKKKNNIISVVLFVVIIALAYMLYDAITTPYKKEMARKAMIERVRLRMTHVRDALIYYRNKNDKFPKEIDSLVAFMKRDTVIKLRADTLFGGSFVKEKRKIYLTLNPSKYRDITIPDLNGQSKRQAITQ